jgi:hypothetical protein
LRESQPSRHAEQDQSEQFEFHGKVLCLLRGAGQRRFAAQPVHALPYLAEKAADLGQTKYEKVVNRLDSGFYVRYTDR